MPSKCPTCGAPVTSAPGGDSQVAEDALIGLITKPTPTSSYFSLYCEQECQTLNEQAQELATLRSDLATERKRAEKLLDGQYHVADSLNKIAVDNVDALLQAWARIAKAEAERDRLKEALKWYADECSMPEV